MIVALNQSFLPTCNKHQLTLVVMLFEPQKDINTYIHMCMSTGVDLLTLLSGLFVRQNGGFSVMIGQMVCQSNSRRRVN